MMRQRLSAAAPAEGKPKVGGVALDVVGGAKQLFAVVVVEAVAQDNGMCGGKPVGLDRHPVLELARETCQRLLGARDGIIEVGFGNAQQHPAQRVGLRDDVMVGEGLDLQHSVFFFRHDDLP